MGKRASRSAFPSFLSSIFYYLSSGSQCETTVKTCDHEPCQNNGTCEFDEVSAFCICPPEFFGIFCEHRKSK